MSIEAALAKVVLIYGSPLLIAYVLYYAYPLIGEPLLYSLLIVFLPLLSELALLISGNF